MKADHWYTKISWESVLQNLHSSCPELEHLSHSNRILIRRMDPWRRPRRFTFLELGAWEELSSRGRGNGNGNGIGIARIPKRAERTTSLSTDWAFEQSVPSPWRAQE